MKRRNFIRSALAISALGLGGVAGFQAHQQSKLDYRETVKTAFLNQDDRLILQVFTPIFAQGVPVPPNINQTILNIDEAIIRLPLKTQDELRELFDLLGNGLGRMIMAGVWLNWQNASESDIRDFLESWRSNALALLQQAYIGLQKLILGSIYSETSHWDDINYPGPLKLTGDV